MHRYTFNTKFQKKRENFGPIHTQITLKQIDYILMNKKWINSALNCEVYSSFEGVFSNQQIVTAKICLSLCRNEMQTTTTAQYDCSLLNNKDISNKYTITLRNKFNAQ